MALEYKFKKKKETVELLVFYDQMQSLADAINQVRKQYKFSFTEEQIEKEMLPLRDALELQNRLKSGSCGVNFDLEW